MAQQFPVSAQVIDNTLVADASFVSAIGAYTFTDQSQLPAVTILTPGTDLPSLSKITGVEVVIHDTGDYTTTSYVAGGAETMTKWSVFVICWAGATGENMQAVTQIICSHFMDSYSIQTVAAADGVGAAVQTKIVILSDKPIIA